MSDSDAKVLLTSQCTNRLQTHVIPLEQAPATPGAALQQKHVAMYYAHQGELNSSQCSGVAEQHTFAGLSNSSNVGESRLSGMSKWP